ncbi:glycoside hydrolase family 97 N-terminal domain-containing protein [Bacteroides sp. CR5/BHMF/2]|nr:glycoside hydrolase family 97 N-terminal domain-containing protein [Bacteroides sp. CR5/BHMF/2]
MIILPFLAEIPGSNTKVCITESDLYDYPGMFLRSNTNGSSMQEYTPQYLKRPGKADIICFKRW